jgi:hypothetical protein
MNANAMSTHTMPTSTRPTRERGRRPVARQICCDIPAGLKGSASKPLPASGHMTGGVESLSGGSVVSCESSEWSMARTLGHGAPNVPYRSKRVGTTAVVGKDHKVNTRS